jgi:hypothetical protein
MALSFDGLQGLRQTNLEFYYIYNSEFYAFIEVC